MVLSNRTWGILQISLSGFCFALLGVFAKTAEFRQIDILALLGVRFLFAGLLLGILCFFFGKIKINTDQFLKSLIMGILGYASFSYFYFKSLSGMAAGAAVVILFLYPIFVYIFELIQHRSKPSLRMIFVLCLSLLGIFLLVGGKLDISNSKSLGYGLTGSFLYGVYVFLSSRFARGMEPYFSTSVIQISAGFCLCLLSGFQSAQLFELFKSNWDLFIGLSVVSSIFPMILFLFAAQKITSFELSVLNVTEPLFGILFSLVLLNEELATIQILGAIFVLGVSVYVSRSKQNSVSTKQ